MGILVNEELHDEDTHCLTPGDGATRGRTLSSVCTHEAHDGGRVFGSSYHDPHSDCPLAAQCSVRCVCPPRSADGTFRLATCTLWLRSFVPAQRGGCTGRERTEGRSISWLSSAAQPSDSIQEDVDLAMRNFSRCGSTPRESLSPLSQSGLDGTWELIDEH